MSTRKTNRSIDFFIDPDFYRLETKSSLKLNHSYNPPQQNHFPIFCKEIEMKILNFNCKLIFCSAIFILNLNFIHGKISSLSGLSLREFLSQSVGHLRIHNRDLSFPQDFDKLFGSRRSRHEKHEEPPKCEKEERDLSLVSLANLVRLGSVVLHLVELQESVRFELEKKEEKRHHPEHPVHYYSAEEEL